MVRRYRADEIDFEAIEKDLEELEPPRIDARTVIGKLHTAILQQKRVGVDDAAILQVLKKHGIKMAASTLNRYLREGKPGTSINARRAKAAADTILEEDILDTSPGNQQTQPRQ